MSTRDLEDAQCVTQPHTFDGTTINDIHTALWTCARCPVLLPCHRWAKTQTRHTHGQGASQSSGINGGVVGLHGVVGGRVYGDALKLLRAWQQRQRSKKAAAA